MLACYSVVLCRSRHRGRLAVMMGWLGEEEGVVSTYLPIKDKVKLTLSWTRCIAGKTIYLRQSLASGHLLMICASNGTRVCNGCRGSCHRFRLLCASVGMLKYAYSPTTTSARDTMVGMRRLGLPSLTGDISRTPFSSMAQQIVGSSVVLGNGGCRRLLLVDLWAVVMIIRRGSLSLTCVVGGIRALTAERNIKNGT